MFLLGRALGMRFGGALLAGVVYAFSLWMVTWISYPHMSVWTLMPWMLPADRPVDAQARPAVGRAAWPRWSALQFLGGHPESSFHALLTTVAVLRDAAVAGVRAAAPGGGGRCARRWRSAARSWAGRRCPPRCWSRSASCCWHSADLHARGGTSVDQHLSREFALGIALPDYWGRPTADPDQAVPAQPGASTRARCR